MDQDIIDVPYSDSLQPQVITIDLPHPPSGTHQSNVQTIIYNQDGHTMTTLQPNDPTTLEECSQIEEKPHIEHDPTSNSNNGNVIVNENENPDAEHKETSLNNSDETNDQKANDETTSNGSKSLTRFKWTKEKSQVAMNLTKFGCKPKIISVAVGCSLRTAQKFVETVTPKMEGESFKNYEIRRRGRKSKDVNQRLEAIREVLSRDSTKTQVEIAADLKVSNTTVCRDLKRIGASWKETKDGELSEGVPSKRTRKARKSNNKTSTPRKKNKTRGRPKRAAKKEKATTECN